MVIRRWLRAMPGRVRPIPSPGSRPRLNLPPLPARLQEQLKDYPGHVERLQRALQGVALARQARLPRIEMALWVLEDHVGRLLAEARRELEAARCSGNAEWLARATKTEAVMFTLRQRHQWLRDEVFVGFFRDLR